MSRDRNDDRAFHERIRAVITGWNCDPELKQGFLETLDSVAAAAPLDDPSSFMNAERAEFVRRLRIDEDFSLRAVAAACAQAWGANWGQNQYCGTVLCFEAAAALNLDPSIFFGAA